MIMIITQSQNFHVLIIITVTIITIIIFMIIVIIIIKAFVINKAILKSIFLPRYWALIAIAVTKSSIIRIIAIANCWCHFIIAIITTTFRCLHFFKLPSSYLLLLLNQLLTHSFTHPQQLHASITITLILTLIIKIRFILIDFATVVILITVIVILVILHINVVLSHIAVLLQLEAHCLTFFNEYIHLTITYPLHQFPSLVLTHFLIPPYFNNLDNITVLIHNLFIYIIHTL